jgi:hypothetical protein
VIVYVLMMAGILAILWPGTGGWGRPALALLALTVIVPPAVVIARRWAPYGWSSAATGYGLLVFAALLVTASGGSTFGRFVLAALVGLVAAVVTRQALRRAARRWLFPLGTDLVGPPVEFTLRLEGGAGSFGVGADGVWVNPRTDNPLVFARGLRQIGLREKTTTETGCGWRDLVAVQAGHYAVGTAHARALRVVGRGGLHAVLPCAEADVVAAICTARRHAGTAPPSWWDRARVVSNERWERDRNDDLTRASPVALLFTWPCLGVAALIAIPFHPAQWPTLLLGAVVAAGLTLRARSVLSSLIERAESASPPAPMPVPEPAPPPGWRADPVNPPRGYPASRPT